MSFLPIIEPWGFNTENGRIERRDQQYFAAVVVMHPAGYPVAAIHEEPNAPAPTDGSPHVIGLILVEINPRGLVHVRNNKGLNGEVLELICSSLSKGELKDLLTKEKPVAVFESNCQRIIGFIGVYRRDVEFPDSEGKTPREIVTASTDGRAITALAKIGLLG